MTAPSDPTEAPEFHEEEQEIVLRLGDILPRVPPHLLKPGPHDGTPQIRFSVEELAAKISRGRVSVPLQRLSSVCPDVFRDSSAFPGDQEVPLPLQKLLEQIGLVSPKAPAGNNISGNQIARARAEAARIIEHRDVPIPATPPEPATPVDPPAPAISKVEEKPREYFESKPEPKPELQPEQKADQQPTASEPVSQSESNEPGQSSSIAKALSSARQFFGLFGKQSEPTRAEEPKIAEPQPAAASTSPAPAPAPIHTESSAVEAAPTVAPTTAEPALPTVPEGCISLRARPVFALLSPPILKPGPHPEDAARVAIPLALIEPQLADGHVEIPIADFLKGLPEDLRKLIDPIPGTLVWIPLDEVFQNLPHDHLFYMPAFDSLQSVEMPLEEFPPFEDHAPVIEEPAKAEPISEAKPEPVAEAKTETSIEPPAITEAKVAPAAPEIEQTASHAQPEPVVEAVLPAEPAPPVAESVAERAAPVPEPAPTAAIAEPIVTPVEVLPPELEQVAEPAPPLPIAEIPVAETALETPIANVAPEPPAILEAVQNPEPIAEPAVTIPFVEHAATIPTFIEAEAHLVPSVEPEVHVAPVAEPAPLTLPSPPPPPIAVAIEPPPIVIPVAPPRIVNPLPQEETPTPPRATWMRGVQVPPPKLFGRREATVASQPAPAATPATQSQSAPPPSTPEAQRTADFLASQPGIFASAAFLESGVFASGEFPARPDLNSLREFLTAFVNSARESGNRLGWNRIIKLPCENFHLTAVVRDNHFLVALHHDRSLSTLMYDTLVNAADELSRSGA